MYEMAAMAGLKYISHMSLERLNKTINSFRVKCPSPGFELGTSRQYILPSSWENMYGFDGWHNLNICLLYSCQINVLLKGFSSFLKLNTY